MSMTIDRETIVSLHKKKVRVIQPSQKSFKFGVKRFGKWSRSSGRQARHPIDRARAETRNNHRTKRIDKNTKKMLRTNPRRSATKLAAEAEIS